MGAPGQPNPASIENGKLGGRPLASHTLQRQLFRKALAEAITKDADKWREAIQDGALGHYAMTKTKDGEIKVYKKSPDVSAWNAAMDRAFGKPEQAVDVTSGGEKIESGQQDPKALALLAEYEKRLRDEYEKP